MLELDTLTKRYGDRLALDGLSFAVAPGAMFGFVGQNGAGKTTAMRIVLGVLAADSGEVRWQGRPVDAGVRRRMGYMPEERGLYPKMRVREQLAYLARLHGTPAAAANSSVDHWLGELGVAERARDRVEALSLGNQQRVQLAAALVHDPEILVLDEPFSGLDPVGVDALAAVLRGRAAAGVPVIFSSHQLELVERLCDAVGIVRAGRIIATGTVDELRRRGRARRLRVVVGARGASLPQRVQSHAGVRVVDQEEMSAGLAVTVELPDTVGSEGVDGVDQAVLDAARAAGPVREFRPVEPSLAELFREAVTA